jgi:hypothetical protein
MTNTTATRAILALAPDAREMTGWPPSAISEVARYVSLGDAKVALGTRKAYGEAIDFYAAARDTARYAGMLVTRQAMAARIEKLNALRRPVTAAMLRDLGAMASLRHTTPRWDGECIRAGVYIIPPAASALLVGRGLVELGEAMAVVTEAGYAALAA